MRLAWLMGVLAVGCGASSHPRASGDGDVDTDVDGDSDSDSDSDADSDADADGDSDVECRDDSDCALAEDHSTCCAGRCGPSAYAVSRIEADPCLVGLEEQIPPECETDCTGEECGWGDCGTVVRAACEAGVCRGAYDCLPGTVLVGWSCEPECATAADCFLARDLSSCCPSCEAASRLDGDPCVVPENEAEPPEPYEPAICTPACDETCPWTGCEPGTTADCVDQRCVLVTEG